MFVGPFFKEIPVEERNKSWLVSETLHCIVSCASPMETQYYLSHIFPRICYYSGKGKMFSSSNVEYYPQCETCQTKDRQKKEKKTSSCIRSPKEMRKNLFKLVLFYFYIKKRNVCVLDFFSDLFPTYPHEPHNRSAS